MRGRAAAWSDPKVQDLASRFVPVADEVGYLQTAKGPECDLFRKIAEQGHYAGRTKPTATRQGIYAATTDGTLLASINTADPAAMAEMLEKALAKWDELPDEARAPETELDADRAHASRAESRFPRTGISLVEYTRDLPHEGGPDDWRKDSWNIDHVWLTRKEARGFFPLERTVGSRRVVPEHLARRMAMFHLVDFAYGQTSCYSPSDVEKASLSSEVTAVEGETVRVRIEGAFRTVARGRWPVNSREPVGEQERGFEGTLVGHATYDFAEDRLIAIELVVVGNRWGGTQYNCRHDGLEPSPVGFVLRLEDDEAARVPPQFIWSDYWAR